MHCKIRSDKKLKAPEQNWGEIVNMKDLTLMTVPYNAIGFGYINSLMFALV